MSRRPLRILAAVLAASWFAVPPPARGGEREVLPATPLAALESIPVREVTIFKDGHAFVVHEGSMATDGNGCVVLDDLPAPVLGTFWPFSAEPGVRLEGVVAGRRPVSVPRTALDLRSLLLANPGAEAWITERGGARYAATILGVPERDREEMARTAPPGASLPPPQPGAVILLRTAEGTKVVPLDRIEDATFRGEVRREVVSEEDRDLLTLRLSREGGPVPSRAAVGMGYLQKGLRWIPSYRVEVGGDGRARVVLQGTIINELTDLRDATAHLVVGVPSFDFEETLDPIALQRTLGLLSPYFQNDLSNAAIASNLVMTQRAARAGEMRAAPSRPSDGPEPAGEGKTEDLFVFRVPHLTLRKGERIVVPVGEVEVPFEDAWALDLPVSLPAGLRGRNDDPRARDLARLLASPRVQHLLRLTNSGKAPFTTAPALVLKDGQVLGQGTMTYTAPGMTVDLPVTAAVDVKVVRSDRETGRKPGAATWRGSQFVRVGLHGEVTLTNSLDRPVTVEVTRWVLGAVDGADHGATLEAVSLFEDGEWADAPGGGPPWWWSGWTWPNWYAHLNGVGRISWKVPLAPGGRETLGYEWHYFWE